MNVLLLNLTRFGDLIQSQAAISDLARQGCSITLVCLENFSGAAGLLKNVCRVETFPGSLLLSLAVREKSTDGRQGWPEALAALEDWKTGLEKQEAFQTVCNLTPTTSARLLARFVAGDRPVFGFGMTEQGFRANSTPWAGLVQAGSLSRKASPFSIVDLFRKIAALHPASSMPPGDALLCRPLPRQVDAAAALLASQSPPGRAGYVALQLGASAECRRWPAEYFAALGDRLWNDYKLCPVLLGSNNELHLASRYREVAAQPFISLIGGTNLSQLAAVLCCVRLLISNDTGTLHLAAGLDCPVLGIFLATAQPFDTGPYKENCCSVEPDLECHPCSFGDACRRDSECLKHIRPEAVTHLAAEFLTLGRWPERAPGLRAWVSRRDARGFMIQRPLAGPADASREAWMTIQRQMFRQFLDRDKSRPFTPEPLDERVPIFTRSRELAADLCTARRLMELLAEQARLLRSRPLPQLRDKFLGTWDRVHQALCNNSWLDLPALLWSEEMQAEDQDFDQVAALIGDFIVLMRALEDQTTPTGSE